MRADIRWGEVIALDGDGKPRSALDIGKDISDWCAEHHYTHESLAELLGVSTKTVQRILNEGKELTSSQIGKLSTLMDKDTDFFIIRDVRQSNGSYRPALRREEAEVNRKLEDKIHDIILHENFMVKKTVMQMLSGLGIRGDKER